MHHRSDAVRGFTESVREVISPLEYLEGTLHPWTSFVIMPIFALANAGIPISSDDVSAAFTSPIALGIFVALVVGKPLGIMAATVAQIALSADELGVIGNAFWI